MATNSNKPQHRIYRVRLRTHAGQVMHLSIISTSSASAMITATHIVKDFKQASARVAA